MATEPEAQQPLQGRQVWTPPEGPKRMDSFRERINAEHGVNLKNYADLHKWSVSEVGKFWQAVWDEMGVVASEKASHPVVENAPMFPLSLIHI